MKKMFFAVGLVLACGAITKAETMTFETPPYTLGSLLGQESWYHAPETAIVTDADASEGSQSAIARRVDCNDSGRRVYAHRILSSLCGYQARWRN